MACELGLIAGSELKPRISVQAIPIDYFATSRADCLVFLAFAL
jgi:hypothetical protein